MQSLNRFPLSQITNYSSYLIRSITGLKHKLLLVVLQLAIVFLCTSLGWAGEDPDNEPTNALSPYDLCSAHCKADPCCARDNPACSQWPIFLYRGEVIEDVVDLQVPGIDSEWEHKRTYSSRLWNEDGGSSLAFIQGNRWMVKRLSEFVDVNDTTFTIFTGATSRDIVETDDDGEGESTEQEVWTFCRNRFAMPVLTGGGQRTCTSSSTSGGGSSSGGNKPRFKAVGVDASSRSSGGSRSSHASSSYSKSSSGTFGIDPGHGGNSPTGGGGTTGGGGGTSCSQSIGTRPKGGGIAGGGTVDHNIYTDPVHGRNVNGGPYATPGYGTWVKPTATWFRINNGDRKKFEMWGFQCKVVPAQYGNFRWCGNDPLAGTDPVLRYLNDRTYQYVPLSDSDPSKAGKLDKITTPSGGVEAYAYSTTTKRTTQVTTTEGWNILYTYITTGINIGRVSQIDVKNPSNQVIQRAKYTYVDSSSTYTLHSDVGSNGDLIMVEVFRRATDDNLSSSIDSAFSLKKVTQYRYESGSRMKMIMESGDIEKIIANNGNVSVASDILAREDSEVSGYAERTFTYYPNNTTNTSQNVTTFFGTENLSTLYIGTDVDEVQGNHQYAKTETVNSECGSCGGGASGSGITLQYHYLDVAQTTPTPNDVTRLVIEDAKDGDDTAIRRKIYGLNGDGFLLRTVLIEDPTATTPIYSCVSYIRGESGKLKNMALQSRFASVHTEVDTAAELRKFLNPTENTNDSDTLNDSTGLITIKEHDYTDYDTTGYVVYEGIANGEDDLATDAGGDYTDVIWKSYQKFKRFDGVNDDSPISYQLEEAYNCPTASTTKPNPSTISNDDKLRYVYTFHDDDVNDTDNDDESMIETKTTILPVISTSENGSGVATKTYEYFNTLGLLIWAKDGEGTVSYYAYNEDTGAMAYSVEDINTEDMGTNWPLIADPPPTGIVDEWTRWEDTDAPESTGEFDFTTDTGLDLVSRTTYDFDGRKRKVEGPDGFTTWYAYLDKENRVYPGWNSTTHEPDLPVHVTKYNDGGKVLESYTFDPSETGVNGSNEPEGDNDTEIQSDYYTWTRNSYADNGLLESVDSYHDIPSSGTGTLSTDFLRTFFKYDAQGRQTHTIQVVSGTDATGLTDSVEQVTKVVYDFRGRTTQVWKGVSDEDHDMKTSELYDNDPTMAKVSERFYDESTPGSGTSYVGNGLVTSTRKYHGTGANDYTSRKYYYNWRGHLRGVEPSGGPSLVGDIDHQNNMVSVAFYDSTSGFGTNWATVLADDDYAKTVATNRRSRALQSYYDKLARIYKIEVYIVDEDDGSKGNKFVRNSYRNRNSQVVATTNSGSVAKEIAYDSIGRAYQNRIVKAIESATNKYDTNGVFKYRSPTPNTTLSSMGGTGDEGVLKLKHIVYASNTSNVEQQINLEINHDDTDGLDMSADDDYIQTAFYRWYNDLGQLTTVANYGSGDTAAGKGSWKYFTLPARSTTAPTASSDQALVGQFEYTVDGLIETIKSSSGETTKVFYDDLGRKTHVSENHTNFTGSSGSGGGTNSDQDRVTQFKYNGLSQIIELIAMDVNGDGTTTDNQITKYLYEDDYFAFLVTNVILPDSSDSDSTGVNQVKRKYNLDGLLSERIDQNGTVMEFAYNSHRQLDIQKATTLGSDVDGHVRSIKIGYDDLARPQTITSYSAADGTGTVRNQVKYHFNDMGQIIKEYQSHEGVVDDDGSGTDTPAVQYIYDESNSSGELTNGQRLSSIIYPDGDRQIHYTYGSSDSISDLLRRIDAIKDDSSGSPGNAFVSYSFNGLGRFVKVLYDQTDASSNDVSLDYTSATAGTYDGFDRFGRVIDHRWENTSTDLDRFQYTYDNGGNRTTRDIPSGLTNNKDQKYTYDDLHRLVNFDRGTLSSGSISSPNREQDFDLDQLGNWAGFDISTSGSPDLEQSRTHNDANEISAITTTTGTWWQSPTYDAAGNVITGPLPDLEDYTSSFKYDAWNRLVEVLDPADHSVAKYEYDGLARRIVKNDDPESADVDYDYYYSTAWQVLEIRKNSDADPYKQYVWDARYIDAPAVRYYDSDTDGSDVVTHYYTNDANMNVTAILNDSGAVVERYEYDPYGKAYVLDANFAAVQGNTSSYDNEILFAGYRLDPESGLYHVRYRMYNPSLGRWIQRDPIGYLNGMNLFEYVSSKPYLYQDPSGLDVFWVARDLDGVFVGNHHFILIIPDNPQNHPQNLTNLSNGQQGFTVGWFNVNGELEVIINDTADLQSINEFYDPSLAGTWSDYDAELNSVSPPNGLTDDEFIEDILEAVDNYTENENNNPVDYDLWDRNCATGTNSCFAATGVPEDIRDDAGEFHGFDWGEEDLLPDWYYQQPCP